MRKFSFAFLSALVALALTATVAFASSPHFINASDSINNSGQLTVTFKEAGLGTNQNINYLLSATAVTTYECVNNGGKNPSASNKTTTATNVSQPGTFSSGKNGSISVNGGLPLSPPSAASLGFSCPKGQTVTFVGVNYTNVQLCDVTNNVCTALPDRSYTNPSAP